MMLYESMSWIASQIPGIILGALGLFATGYVNEFFAKRAESRKNRKELFETFGGILIKAEDDMWKSVSISEKPPNCCFFILFLAYPIISISFFILPPNRFN